MPFLVVGWDKDWLLGFDLVVEGQGDEIDVLGDDFFLSEWDGGILGEIHGGDCI